MASRSFGRSPSSHSMNARMELARTAKRLRLSASASSADTGSFPNGFFKLDPALLPVRLHGRRPAAIAAIPKPWSFSRTDLNHVNEYFKRNTHAFRRCPGKNRVESPTAITPFDCILAPALATPKRQWRAARLRSGRAWSRSICPIDEAVKSVSVARAGRSFRPGDTCRAGRGAMNARKRTLEDDRSKTPWTECLLPNPP